MKTTDNLAAEYTMGLGRVHLYILLMIIPVLLVYLGTYILIWDFQDLRPGLFIYKAHFVPVTLAGIVVHELLHGISWSFFVPGGLKSIRFGINWKFIAPYCHCKEPLKVRHYKIGIAMPLIVLGVCPSLAGIVSGNGAFLFFGIVFTWVAGGDIISLFMLRKLNNDTYVSDHPDKMGFYLESKSDYRERINDK